MNGKTMLKFGLTAGVTFIMSVSCGQLKRLNKVPPYAISLVPSVTEIIYAMGAERHLLAVVEQCDYPPEAKSLPKVGSMVNPSKELILSLKPDVVFVASPTQELIKKELEDLGIKCVDISPKSIIDIIESIHVIGKALHEEEKARRLADSLKMELFTLSAKRTSLTGRMLRVYIEIQPNPIVTVGRNSFIDNYILLAGGKNVFSYIDLAYPTVSPEEVVHQAPDVIILAYKPADIASVRNRLGWKDIPAVKHNCIFGPDDIDIDVLVRPGPRFVQAITELRKLLLEAEKRLKSSTDSAQTVRK
ncbi:MAG: hypothetical protein DRQ10_08965 [Candidatus Hydrothermota bacterium]|nr:MAG: hypothetical protein DRQ10_08965 [Candidatus Hydrothermae bacterium]